MFVEGTGMQVNARWLEKHDEEPNRSSLNDNYEIEKELNSHCISEINE